MTFDEAEKVVDELLTSEAKAAGKRSKAPVRLTTAERRAIERVLTEALDLREAA